MIVNIVHLKFHPAEWDPVFYERTSITPEQKTRQCSNKNKTHYFHGGLETVDDVLMTFPRNGREKNNGPNPRENYLNPQRRPRRDSIKSIAQLFE